MAKRKYKRRTGKKNNTLLVFLIIIIGITILSFVISYFVTQTESGEENIANTEETKSNEISNSDKLTLEGTWASHNDGAMLTIKGQNFSIEQPSVESPFFVKGKIVIKDSKVTFVYTTQDSECGIRPGIYEFKFKGNDEVTFKKVDDKCGNRSSQLGATWFKV